MSEAGTAAQAPKSFTQKLLDGVERVGNKVPHPVVIFVLLIGLVVVMSHLLYLLGTSVAYQVLNPETHELEDASASVRSLLTLEGIRFMFTSVVQNFMNFNAVGVIIVAMVGVGVAEEAGLVKTLIRKLVMVSPRWALTYILVFVGIVSSIAADAGYLVLIPLAAAAFISVGRHPLAGLAASFAGVASAFGVNILIKPLDGILTEITNDAIHLLNPNVSIDLTANMWFSMASVVLLTVVISVITERIVEPRLGAYAGEESTQEGAGISPDEARGLRYANYGLLAVIVLFAVLTVPAGAPLRNPETGAIIGNSPLMNGLIVAITVLFLVMGVGYGIGARTIKNVTDVINAMVKTIGGLAGLIFLLLVISQFLAYFNFTNMATVIAVKMADALQNANLDALWLLIGFVIVVAVLDIIITGAIPKWAIFAPIFVPLLMKLNVAPEAVLAAYRVGDSPMNAVTPLNAYFALIVTFAQKYQKDAGVGTVVALMLPYVAIIFVVWTILLAVWHLLGLPWGLG
ncbi:MAG TPA: AbgT family transporter [Candidatus Bathyarchaeia archaeon]|nr:AbgT family transporter [Candidatus Bathyarchaeia archaeon]